MQVGAKEYYIATSKIINLKLFVISFIYLFINMHFSSAFWGKVLPEMYSSDSFFKNAAMFSLATWVSVNFSHVPTDFLFTIKICHISFSIYFFCGCLHRLQLSQAFAFLFFTATLGNFLSKKATLDHLFLSSSSHG